MLGFKYQRDLDYWRQFKGPRLTRDRITLANAIAEAYFQRSILVTSWYCGRKDGDPSGHTDGTCFDIRFKDWNPDEIPLFCLKCVDAGIPIMDIGEGSGRHGHVGDLMTLVTEGR